jgi:hypothetical protein
MHVYVAICREFENAGTPFAEKNPLTLAMLTQTRIEQGLSASIYVVFRQEMQTCIHMLPS